MKQGRELDSSAIEDYDIIRELIDKLVTQRRELCTQTQVANLMKTSQGAVSAVERMAFDSRLITIMQYARAVGYRITGFTVEPIESHHQAGLSLVHQS